MALKHTDEEIQALAFLHIYEERMRKQNQAEAETVAAPQKNGTLDKLYRLLTKIGRSSDADHDTPEMGA